MSLTDVSELKRGYRELGAIRFWLLMATTAAYIGVGAWLLVTTNWPADCDASGGGRAVRLITAYRCSPHLLSRGALEVATFLWLWAMPVGALGFVLYARLRKRAAAGPISVE